MDEAGRHHPLRRGKEAVTTPWRSVQNAEKANGTVAWQALPCRFDALRLVQGKGLLKSKSQEVAQRLPIPRFAGLERFMVDIRRRPLPLHGTDHDSKPLPSFPRFCLPVRLLQCRQEEYRSGRATAQGFGRSLLALPFDGARLRPAHRTAL